MICATIAATHLMNDNPRQTWAGIVQFKMYSVKLHGHIRGTTIQQDVLTNHETRML
jgi:hypothetical protein